MVDAVNKLIANQIAGSGEVFLPDVGSLFVERRPAQRLSKRSVLPPCRVVGFSSQQRGASLLEAIARAAQCTDEQAREVYDRWLGRTRTENGVVIEGVGELKFKNFTLEESFDALLNPQGHAPVEVRARRRRFDPVLWIGVVGIFAAAGIGLYSLYYFDRLPFGRGDATEVAAAAPGAAEASAAAERPSGATDEAAAQNDTAAAQTDTAASEAAALPAAGDSAAPGAAPSQQPGGSASQPAATQPATAGQQPAAATGDPARLVRGTKYVVMGVYSTRQNAERAVAVAATGERPMRCTVYRFGEKWMVSPFASEDAAACARFIGEHRAAFPDLWTYTAR